jgi:hypothetical protein
MELSPSVFQLLQNFPAFFGTERLIAMLKEPYGGPYPELDESNCYYSIGFL